MMADPRQGKVGDLFEPEKITTKQLRQHLKSIGISLPSKCPTYINRVIKKNRAIYARFHPFLENALGDNLQREDQDEEEIVLFIRNLILEVFQKMISQEPYALENDPEIEEADRKSYLGALLQLIFFSKLNTRLGSLKAETLNYEQPILSIGDDHFPILEHFSYVLKGKNDDYIEISTVQISLSALEVIFLKVLLLA